MTGAILHKLTPLLLSMALLTGLMATSAEAKPRVVKGGFTATATPFPNPWETLPGMSHGCASGNEGQHKVSHPFKAPFAGWFHAQLTFDGDWDLYLADEQGVLIAESLRNEPIYYGGLPKDWAEIDLFLAKGEEIFIVACNWAGGLEAEARYDHREARAWPGPPTGEVTHEDRISYFAPPALATTDNSVLCLSWNSCREEFDVWGNDRFVSVEITDTNAAAVAFKLIQFRLESTRMYGKNYCGSTEDPVAIDPGADVIVVQILTGPCEGGSTFHVPTTGTLHLEFRG